MNSKIFCSDTTYSAYWYDSSGREIEGLEPLLSPFDELNESIKYIESCIYDAKLIVKNSSCHWALFSVEKKKRLLLSIK